MGAKSSKPKKYSAKDMFQRTNWDDEDNVLDRNREAVVPGDMDGPYQPQGEPDAYINFCQCDAIDNDAVWQRRTSYEDLLTMRPDNSYETKGEDATLLRSELYVEPTEMVETIETVFDGPDHRGENDIYEEPKFLHESFFNKGSPLPLRPARRSPSETNIKQPVDTCEIATVNKYIDFSSSVKQQRQLHRYEEMVLIFEPLILKNVIARQIIPHLTFLDDPEKVRVIAERDQRAAVVCIIDELRTNQTDPGRWKQFIEALERCGYSNIAGVLRGDKPADHTYQREYLKLMTPELRDNIASPLDLTEVLWSANVLSDEDKEEIQQTHERFGVLAANDRLLDRVPRKHKYWYSHLIDCLRNTNMTHAADMLDIPELRSLSVYNDAYLKPQNSKLGPETAGENTHKRPSTKQFKDLHNTICKRKLNDDEYGMDEQLYGELPTDSTLNYILTEQTITSEHSKGSKQLVGKGTDELSEAYDEGLAYDEAYYDDVQYNIPPPPIPPLADGSQENSHSNGAGVGGSNDSQTKVHIESTSSQLSLYSLLYNNTSSISNNNATTINNNSASKTEKGEVVPPIVIRPKNIQTEEYEEYSDPDDDGETLLSSEATDRPPFALTPLPSWIKERPLPQPPTELPLPSWSTKLRVPTPPPGGSNGQPDTPTTPPPVPERLPLIQNINNLNELSSIEDFDECVVVIRSLPTEIGISSPFPEPFVDCSKRNKTQHNSRTASLNKRPVPLPRQRVLTTGVNTLHEQDFGQIEEEFEDDGYTEPDENPTPVIGEDNTDKLEVNGDGVNDKEQTIMTRPEEHIWGYVEPRNKKCRVKYPSQKTKKKYKRLAQSRKKKGGINFRKFFHMKELKTTKEEEPEKRDAQPVSIDDKKEPPRRSVRSKSLPQVITEEVTESLLYYSDAFIDAKRKTNQAATMPAIDESKMERKETDSSQKVIDTPKDDFKELLDICVERHGVDQKGITREISASAFTNEEIHPDIQEHLEDVKKQREELTVLIYQEPVLKTKLEMQSVINVKLKDTRTIKEQLREKELEAAALKEASTYNYNRGKMETVGQVSTGTYYSPITSANEMNTNRQMPVTGDNTTTADRVEPCVENGTEHSEIVLPNDKEVSGAITKTGSEKVVIETDTKIGNVINKTDPIVDYKDSAFYSDGGNAFYSSDGEYSNRPEIMCNDDKNCSTYL